MKNQEVQASISKGRPLDNRYFIIAILFLTNSIGVFSASAQSQIRTDPVGMQYAYGGVRLPIDNDGAVSWGRAYKSKDNHFLIEYKSSKNLSNYKILDFSCAISDCKKSSYLSSSDEISGLDLIKPESILILPNGNVVNTVIDNPAGLCPWPYSAEFSFSSPEKEIWKKSIFMRTRKPKIWNVPKYCSAKDTKIPLKYRNLPVSVFPYKDGFVLVTYSAPYIVSFSNKGETEFFSNRSDVFLTQLPRELQTKPNFEGGQEPDSIRNFIELVEKYIIQSE